MHSETIIKWNIWWLICNVQKVSLHLPSKLRNQHWFIYSIYKLSPKIYVPDRDYIHMDYLYILNSCLKEESFSAFACPNLSFQVWFNSSSSMKPPSLISATMSDHFFHWIYSTFSPGISVMKFSVFPSSTIP